VAHIRPKAQTALQNAVGCVYLQTRRSTVRDYRDNRRRRGDKSNANTTSRCLALPSASPPPIFISPGRSRRHTTQRELLRSAIRFMRTRREIMRSAADAARSASLIASDRRSRKGRRNRAIIYYGSSKAVGYARSRADAFLRARRTLSAHLSPRVLWTVELLKSGCHLFPRRSRR